MTIQRPHSLRALLPCLLQRPFVAVWIYLFASFQGVFGQPNDLFFHHLTPAQGLSQSTNPCIYRDRSGFVWIGSSEGLNRFDGVRVKVYKADPGDACALADPTVTSPVFEDRREDLWFCTHTAVHRYRRQYDDFERFVLYDAAGTALKGYQVFGLDRQERLWVHCNGQVYRFDVRPAVSERFHPVLAIDANSFCYFETDSLAATGALFAIGETGVVRYQCDLNTVRLTDTLFTGVHVNCIYQERSGVVWAGSDEGLFQVHPNGRIRSPVDSRSTGIRQIKPWGTTYLFAATDQGLFLVDKASGRTVRQWTYDNQNPAGLSANILAALHIDEEDNLWVSAWTKGVDYTNLRKLKFQTRRFYTTDVSGESHLFVPGPMLQDSRKRIWCGSQMQGLLALQNDGIQYEDFSALAPAPDQLFDLGDGRLLVNNFGSGLSILNPEIRQAHNLLRNGEPVARFHICRVSPHEFVLASGVGAPGLLKLTVSGLQYKFESIGSEQVISKDWYYVICQSAHEFLMADDNYTVYYFNEAHDKPLEQVTALPGYINCSLEDEQNIWLGGSFGLCRISRVNHAFQYITAKEGLTDNMIYAILRLNPREWWLSTGKGLVRFDPITLHFQKFGLADGLQAFEYNRRSCLHASDGSVWFGGVGGYNRFEPAALQLLDIQPRVQVIDIQVNDGAYPYRDNPVLVKSLRLPYDSATLTFHFVALEFSDPAGNRLKYRLDFSGGTPYDQDWVDCPDARGFARYANLPPGRYILRILGANSDGIWNASPKEISIEITPPFYQTWWFRVLAGLALLLLSYAVYRSRLIAMRKKEEQKRRMIELELNALRAQLNPHFISNNLISINNFIRNNGVEKVRAYVATFARLMRNVLESARNPLMPLSEELNMLQNFVEVESGRFPRPIDFSIEVQNGLDTARYFLPGMLLQPFLENAIVHGLGPRNGAGKIRMYVSKHQDILVFVIEDDGVGRNERAGGPITSPERKSHGLDITRQRLQLYDLQNNTVSELETEDLNNTDGTPSGTRVTLRLGIGHHA